VSDGSPNEGFEPVLAIPMGSSFGMLGGVVVGVTLLDNIGLGIGMGVAFGTMVGAVAYALLERPEDR
jgi:hypothetical protein